MVLNHHGATRDPLTGGPTTPETVNNYFRQGEKCDSNGCTSRGYSYGLVEWPVAANYSSDANAIYATQKVEWNGGGEYNPTMVTNDLLVNNPVVLKVLRSSHWATAISVLTDTFGLNDPAHDKTKLSDIPYNNTAFALQRYKPTHSDFSFLDITSLSPTQILVTAPDGKRTGYDKYTGTIIQEIPNSYYGFEETITDDTQQDQSNQSGDGVYSMTIKTPIRGLYKIHVTGSISSPYGFTIHTSDRNASLLYDIFEGTQSDQRDVTYQFNYSPEPDQETLSLETEVDIKPESSDNPINCKKNSVIPVVLFSTNTFDARKVDLASVFLEGAKEIHIDKKAGKPERHETDIDRDGDADLVFHFNFNDTVLTCSSTKATLRGKTTSGLLFNGTNTIKTGIKD